jgi:hypothetical protein
MPSTIWERMRVHERETHVADDDMAAVEVTAPDNNITPMPPTSPWRTSPDRIPNNRTIAELRIEPSSCLCRGISS